MRFDDTVKTFENLNKKSDYTVRKLTDKEKELYKVNERKIVLKELKIDEELKDLLPPLSDEEFKKLEERILKDGCLIPLFTWNGYIADGHNRYNICTKHNVPFQTQELAYDTKSEVMHWMIDGQLGRRNLTIVQRIQVAEKYREKLKEEAKARQLSTLKQNQDDRLLLSEKSETPKHTSKELAKLAEVGSGTMARYEYVMNNGDEDLKKKMLNNEIPITAAYDILQQKKNIQKEQPEQERPQEDKTEEKIIIYANEKQNLKEEISNTPQDTIKDIIRDMKTPKYVANNFDFINELESIIDNIKSSIEYANDDLFEKYNIDSKITLEEKDLAVSYFEELIEELVELKNKINKINVREI